MLSPTAVPIDRRHLLAGLVASALLAATGGCGTRSVADLQASAGTPWRGEGAPVGSVTLVGQDEPGEPLDVTGTVFGSDGVTPLAGARLDLYQTDVEGLYSRPKSDPRRARIRGSVRTDSKGRYSFRTIQPGSYGTGPAHVHVHLAAPGLPDHWIPSFYFAGDPHLRPRDAAANEGLGAFSAILVLDRDETGVLRGRRDVRADPVRAERNRLVEGWYRGE